MINERVSLSCHGYVNFIWFYWNLLLKVTWLDMMTIDQENFKYLRALEMYCLHITGIMGPEFNFFKLYNKNVNLPF